MIYTLIHPSKAKASVAFDVGEFVTITTFSEAGKSIQSALPKGSARERWEDYVDNGWVERGFVPTEETQKRMDRL